MKEEKGELKWCSAPPPPLASDPLSFFAKDQLRDAAARKAPQVFGSLVPPASLRLLIKGVPERRGSQV